MIPNNTSFTDTFADRGTGDAFTIKHHLQPSRQPELEIFNHWLLMQNAKYRSHLCFLTIEIVKEAALENPREKKSAKKTCKVTFAGRSSWIHAACSR